MSATALCFLVIGGLFALYGFAAAVAFSLRYLLVPRHQRVWAVVPLRGRVDNPEALLHSASVSRLYECGLNQIWFVDAGMDRESKQRCRQLAENGKFPSVLKPDEFAELLQFPSE